VTFDDHDTVRWVDDSELLIELGIHVSCCSGVFPFLHAVGLLHCPLPCVGLVHVAPEVPSDAPVPVADGIHATFKYCDHATLTSDFVLDRLRGEKEACVVLFGCFR
jgi:hypothetical protein